VATGGTPGEAAAFGFGVRAAPGVAGAGVAGEGLETEFVTALVAESCGEVGTGVQKVSSLAGAEVHAAISNAVHTAIAAFRSLVRTERGNVTTMISNVGRAQLDLRIYGRNLTQTNRSGSAPQQVPNAGSRILAL
jgi:hypothetical protein